MAEDKQQSTDPISQERYDAVVRERDAANAKAEERGVALIDLQKRNAAATALTGKVANPDGVADMVTQFLTDVKVEDVADHIGSDEFKPRLANFQPAAPPPSTDEGGKTEGEGGTSTAAVEEPGSFGGPSPGGTTGTQTLESKTMIKVGSPEYQTAIANNDVEQLEKWEKDGLLVSPVRPWV